LSAGRFKLTLPPPALNLTKPGSPILRTLVDAGDVGYDNEMKAICGENERHLLGEKIPMDLATSNSTA
uniref:hypothetical protein n=1 Tax=Burkholderia glumae TaxID=337 RepID=UPI0019D6BAAE